MDLTRRAFLAATGGLALPRPLSGQDVWSPTIDPRRPLAARPPMFPARAKSVILLVTQGGMSQMDTFDPKPELDRHHGKKLTGDLLKGAGEVKTFFGGKDGSPLMKSPYRFRPRGQSGIEVSEIFPRLGDGVDDLALVRSVHCDSNSHTPALFQLNTGYIQQGWPSLGAWILYALGTENPDLPGFVVMVQANSLVNGGPNNWGSGFLSATYQGTYLRSGGTPILDLHPPADFPPAAQKGSLELLRKLNDAHRAGRDGDTTLDARIASYELALRMQASTPAAVDLSKETEETKTLYGLDRPESEDIGRKCLLARRFIERGVRFVQIFSGSSQCGGAWDAHGTLAEGHRKCAASVDRPFAGLLADLKRRGLLSQTLVVGASEFGRMPITQGGTGRDHNPGTQTVWLAGAGIRPGTVVGASDELGYKAVVDPHPMRDLHATILHLLGLDDLRLTYYFNGRHQRLTENGGQLIRKALA